jgi:hypothetical protein
MRNPIVRMTIYNRVGQAITHLNTTFHPQRIDELPASGAICCRIERLPLSPGTYRVNASLNDYSGILDHLESIMTFDVDVGNYYKTTHPSSFINDVCLLDHTWVVDTAGA